MAGDMEYLDFGTIFFFVAAVVIFLQLRKVLGRRTGNERPPFNPYASSRTAEVEDKAKPGDNVVSLPRRGEPKENQFEKVDALATPGTPLNEGLRAIQNADPAFDPAKFLEGSKMAYEMIVMSFADGDRKTLKSLLSREVFDGFVSAIADRESRGEKVQSSFVGINKAEITGAEMKGTEAHVTVRVVSELISATLDKDGNVIDGDKEAVAEVKDVWTYARDTRSKDPNWKLVATEAED
ncbi:putative lipid-binding transport protein (Tim44 family) [Phyllobacterium myrsinacearum]|nr:putative lipid-binding transport protein (Tim44 family) [Phyllobacterium myrsinacearum]RZS82476.1 putative lipid-binding transport protein (Tim44 family) [Phyllobacterium myrsinacearum]RZV07539.1 putative lipid-binding transport protein (Tim44 family) [Phyllobacterium myrsinacearum]